jgi:GTP-binding protein
MELLDRAAVSYGIVLTKADELKPAGIAAVLARTAAEAHRHTAALEEIHATSSRDGTGIPELRQSLAALAA